MMGRYAVHCSGVAFSCKKHGDNTLGLNVTASATTVDRIRSIHGSSVANEVIEFEASNERWGLKSSGWISNANYHGKRLSLLLFINHRAVESSVIKKAVEQTYSTFLPKGSHPFLYLSLEIDPARVDVNVHPTKREVNFLNEDEIVEAICDEIRVRLGNVDTSRTFVVQSLLPGAQIPTISANSINPASSRPQTQAVPSTPRATSASQLPASTSNRTATPKVYENNLVRTDAKTRKITSMLPPSTRPSRSSPTKGPDPNDVTDIDMQDAPHADRPPPTTTESYIITDRVPTTIRLSTIRALRASVRDNMHNGLSDMLASHTFVGIVDTRRRIAAIQAGVKLLLVDYGMLCNEYFYQIGLTDFGNFGSIRLDPPLSLTEILRIAAAQEAKSASLHAQDDDDVNWDDIVQAVAQQLISVREMLSEYFSLEISSQGDILALPLLMKGYTPSLAKLPRFLLRLGPHVDWEDEQGCFHSFLRELASWYVPDPLAPLPKSAEDEDGASGGGKVDEELIAQHEKLAYQVEHLIFPAFKSRLVATTGMLKGVIEVANLKGLYRVFERC